jgi:hypothetical protein
MVLAGLVGVGSKSTAEFWRNAQQGEEISRDVGFNEALSSISAGKIMAEGTIVEMLFRKPKRENENITNCPRCPCGQCTRKLVRRAHADVTSYGRGYDPRDVVSKTQIRKLKYYNCPRCPCGQCTRKRLRRAHAVDYRRHGWWATPVVKSSKLVVSSMKLTKRVAGFVVFLFRPWSSPRALKTRAI